MCDGKDGLHSHVGGGKGLLPSSIHKHLAGIHMLYLKAKHRTVVWDFLCDTVTLAGTLVKLVHLKSINVLLFCKINNSWAQWCEGMWWEIL